MNSAQRVVGQGVIVAAGADVFELAGFAIVPLGVHAIEEEPLDFVGGVQSVAVLLVQRWWHNSFSTARRSAV